jgi:hypothetical protein
MIEINHIKDLLEQRIKDGIIPEVVKDRVSKTHFELYKAVDFLMNSDLRLVKKIIPIHLSGNSADPETIYKTLKFNFPDIEIVMNKQEVEL